MLFQHGYGFDRQDRFRNFTTFHVPGDQGPSEFRNVILALTKRWKRNLERVDPEVKVFAERPFGHHFLNIAIGRTDDADVDMKRFILADASNFTRFEEPQQFDLHRFVEFAEFVEKQCSSIGDFDQAFARFFSPSIRTFSVSEQFAFNQMFGQGSTVHWDERHIRTWTQVMDSPGNQFFTRSRFALNQDAGIGWSDLFAQFFHAKHWWRVTNQVR